MTRNQLYTLIATIIGSGIVILDGTVVNLALPHIAKDLGASFNQLQWIVDGYLLSLSALILLGGSLGDIMGRKRVYLVGLVGFGISSLLCGIAPHISLLLAARVLQGVFGALLVPGALAIINTNFSHGLRSQAIGRWIAWSSVAAAVGPLLGGYLVDAASWRWIFFINVPAVAVCYWMATRCMHETKDDEPRHLDVPGAALAFLGLGGITFGLIQGPIHDWNISSLVAIAVGVIASVLFIRQERRTKDPMMPLSLFRSRNFTGANIATFAMYGALGGFFFALGIYVQTKLGFSAFKTGLSFLPVTLLILALSGKFGALAGTYGSRIFMTLGPLTAAVGMGWLYWLQPGSNYWTSLFPGISLFGLGMAITIAPLTTTVMSAVRDADSGIASGINNAVARASGLIIIALLGLFGTDSVYRFTVVLCVSLAASAGVISFLTIRDKLVKEKALPSTVPTS